VIVTDSTEYNRMSWVMYLMGHVKKFQYIIRINLNIVHVVMHGICCHD